MSNFEVILGNSLVDMCPHCWGSGKLKAMQLAYTQNGESTRVNDKYVECNHCEGKGKRK